MEDIKPEKKLDIFDRDKLQREDIKYQINLIIKRLQRMQTKFEVLDNFNKEFINLENIKSMYFSVNEVNKILRQQNKNILNTAIDTLSDYFLLTDEEKDNLNKIRYGD